MRRFSVATTSEKFCLRVLAGQRTRMDNRSWRCGSQSGETSAAVNDFRNHDSHRDRLRLGYHLPLYDADVDGDDLIADAKPLYVASFETADFGPLITP